MTISGNFGRRELLLGFAGALAAAERDQPRITDKHDRIIYRNEHGYSAWPTILQAKNGDLLIAFDEAVRRHKVTHADPTDYAMVIRSTDGGKSWGEVTAMTNDPKIFFSEPALLLVPNGKLIVMMRTHEGGDYYLYQADSTDDGKTWTEARRTGMWGYPPHMIRLRDGSILCTYGRRKTPFGVRACLSNDQGASWDTAHELVLRDDFRSGNLGYPTSTQFDDGRIMTVYYGEDDTGTTCIHASIGVA